jgi:hypothetical protein
VGIVVADAACARSVRHTSDNVDVNDTHSSVVLALHIGHLQLQLASDFILAARAMTLADRAARTGRMRRETP